MLYWKFYISNIEVEEPQGWDGVEFLLKRSQNFTGLENVYTPSQLTFDSKGADLITAAYKLSGFDGSLPFKVEMLCDGQLTERMEWSLNLFHYKKTNNEVSISAEETNFQSRFKNRSGARVSLEDTKTIGGITVQPPNAVELGLHCKSIRFYDGASHPAIAYDLGDLATTLFSGIISLPVFVDSNESNAMRDVSAFVSVKYSPYEQHITAQYPALYEIKYHFNGSVYMFGASPHSFRLSFAYTIYTERSDATVAVATPGIANIISSQIVTADASFKSTTAYNHQGSLNINLNAGQNVTFYLMVDNLSTPMDLFGVRNTVIANKLELLSDSLFPPSTAKTYTIFEAFNRVVTLITDKGNSFKSDFFSQLSANNDTAGCGSNTNVTNGKNIRNMLQKDGTKFPISTSFDELYQSADSVWCLGYRIEYDSYGRGSVRVEPKSYFFKNQATRILENVSDIEYGVAHEKIFNEITIGYEKWNLNTGRVNGIDEFNTIHHYSLPVTNANKKINAVSKAIASGYVLEITRRIQYNENPTSDFETDDDLFFIATNPFEVTSTQYTLDKSSRTYAAGTVSERDENFTTVENLLSPSTAYNLRLSPKRNLARWWGYVASSLFWKIKANPNTEIKFNSGEGNILERDLMTGYCDDFGGYLCRQNDNIKQLNLFNGSLLFVPTLARFQYPITMNTFTGIRKDADKTIQFSCGLEAQSGFIEEVNYTPNSENGTSEFTLLLSPDGAGAFDEGFDNGFDI